MKYWLIALLLLSLGACTGIRQSTQPPEVRLSKVALTTAGLFEQRWQLTLRVQNPNDHALSVRKLAYRVLIDEQPFAQGNHSETIVLPALGDELVTTELTTNLLGNVSRVSALLAKDSGSPVPYRIEGKAVLGSMPVPVGFSWSGRWPEVTEE